MKKLTQKQIDAIKAKAALTAKRTELTSKQLLALHVRAHAINKRFNEIRKARIATRKEFNATKRTLNTNQHLSAFCKSMKTASQAFRIDTALQEFHSMKELLALDTLSDCKESRIKSHISFLEHEFRHSCKRVVNEKNDKQFKFISI